MNGLSEEEAKRKKLEKKVEEPESTEYWLFFAFKQWLEKDLKDMTIKECLQSADYWHYFAFYTILNFRIGTAMGKVEPNAYDWNSEAYTDLSGAILELDFLLLHDIAYIS